MRKSILLCTVAVLVFFGLLSGVQAYQFSFDNITNNNAGDAAIGEAQLSMDVTGNGSQILFTFLNSGPEASSITDIYFDDDVPLLAFSSFIPSAGVTFTVGASPGNLPGGNLYSFSSNYDYDSDNPTQPMGVNPGESLGLVFNPNLGATLDSVIESLNIGSLRVGIHVQGFASGGSESFLNTPGTPIPEPATFLLVGIGLLGIAGATRKKITG
jgi:hypothetical protein